MAEHEHHPEHVFEEKERIGKLSQIRELVFGAQDGLLVPLGVVTGVAGASASNHIIIIAGIAEALAGAFSMATGAYLASRAELSVHQSEIKKERGAIKSHYKDETEELVLLYEKDGLSRKDAEIVVEKLATSEIAFLNAMVYQELGLDPHPAGTPFQDALSVGYSYAIAAVIPLAPYFFLPTQNALPVSIIATLLALFGIGLLKARFASLPYFSSGLQVLAIGAFAAFGGYFLGTVVPKLFGY